MKAKSKLTTMELTWGELAGAMRNAIYSEDDAEVMALFADTILCAGNGGSSYYVNENQDIRFTLPVCPEDAATIRRLMTEEK
jgi:hypothetical protein